MTGRHPWQGSRVFSYAYDSRGNLVTATQTAYNLDAQVSLISRPSGDSIVPSYDSAGKLSSLAASSQRSNRDD